MKYKNQFKKLAQSFAFCAIAVALLLLGSCEKESGFNVEDIKPVTEEVKAGSGYITMVGDLKENGYQIFFNGGTFNEDVIVSVTASAGEADKAYKSTSKFDRMASPINVNVDGRQGTVWLNEMATVTFPLPNGFALSPKNNYQVYGSFYNPETRTVEYISPDLNELQSGRITFTTMHFTDICPVLLKDTEACTKFAHDRAAAAVEEEKKKADTDKLLGDSFREIYNKMGVTDKSLEETLVRGALAESNITSFATAIYDGELGSAAGALPEVAGAFLIKHLKVSNMSEIALRTANPNIIPGVGNAVQHLYKGNYAEAGKEIAKTALDSYPPTRYLRIANELINYSVICYYGSQQKEILAHFQKTGASISNESDWSIAMTKQFQSLLRKIQGDVINSYCKLNNISRSSLPQSEIDRLHSQAERDLRTTLKDRIASDAKIKQKQEEYLDIIRHFKEDFLLDGFAYGVDIDLRLSRLFNWREKIVAMVGGPLRSDKYSSDSPEENLRYALKNYIALVMDVGNTKMIPGGELAFYDWLVEEGFIKEINVKLAGTTWRITVSGEGSTNSVFRPDNTIVSPNAEGSGKWSQNGSSVTFSTIYTDDFYSESWAFTGTITSPTDMSGQVTCTETDFFDGAVYVEHFTFTGKKTN
jgi:hypothetical protein